MKALIVAFVVLVCLIVLMLDARSQPQHCGPERDVLDMLSKRWGEWPVWIGPGPGSKIILLRNETKGWTVLKVDKGTACVIAVGTGNRFDAGT